ncbi:hypothetical protein AK812_SmicGene24581 [Symbiodinium microadriaticum]|uniref:Uncharacterized protein n=1 Tax=Symbiodinium microadriaticum TaxID=2951 RepID=A0A1Q9DE99_SYMMI|nr:hypothetical protein AK812_SmicGene24581 [Symbiodinium microadriaticum]CAE7802120.1 unnamed protein product [Symbiodinium microadriaticum]
MTRRARTRDLVHRYQLEQRGRSAVIRLSAEVVDQLGNLETASAASTQKNSTRSAYSGASSIGSEFINDQIPLHQREVAKIQSHMKSFVKGMVRGREMNVLSAVLAKLCTCQRKSRKDQRESPRIRVVLFSMFSIPKVSATLSPEPMQCFGDGWRCWSTLASSCRRLLAAQAVEAPANVAGAEPRSGGKRSQKKKALQANSASQASGRRGPSGQVIAVIRFIGHKVVMFRLGAPLALPLLGLLLPAASLPFAEDDECDGSDGSECALQALQRRAVQGESSSEVSLGESNSSFRYCHESCWLKYGFVKGDCRCDVHRGWYMWICWKRNGVRIKPEYGHQFNCHGLTHAAPAPPPPPPPKEYTSSYNPKYRVRNPELVNASTAPLMTFHLYRVQSDANYSCCANADLTTAGAAMFYLHNEIVWHAKSRAGTNFADPKTRIRRYKVWTRATQPLYDLGMNFGVMNEFDITECTGPFDCENFKRFGYTVGCENWVEGSAANFPHQKWNKLNFYPNAAWFSLPGPCPFGKLDAKSASCKATQPGGQCPEGIFPDGSGDCTYQIAPAGEIRIDDLVGITEETGNYANFIKVGGREYDPVIDQGVHLNFWDGRFDAMLCEWRTKKLEDMFAKKYPDDPTIEAPECDFNKWKFYHGTSHKP